MNAGPVPFDVPATQTSRRVIPAAGTPRAKVTGDPAHRESFYKQLQSMNKHVVTLYRLGVFLLLGAGKLKIFRRSGTAATAEPQSVRRFPSQGRKGKR